MERSGVLPVCLVLLQYFTTSESLYEGYHVFAVTPHSQGQVDDLAQYLQSQENIDIWTLPRDVDKEAKFMVPGDQSVHVESWLKTHSIKHHIESDDMQSVVEEAAKDDAVSRYKSRLSRNGIDLNIYNNHDDMNSYLMRVAEDCDICSIINIGQSYEGRDMLVLKIGQWSLNKPSIWIDAGIHAREWIAPATALNVIDKLINGYRIDDVEVMYMLDHFIFFILPSANPDGYMHSRNHDRLWRKTRKPTRRPECIGTDPNRNWNYHWAESGVSFDQCSEVFPGGGAFSEPETRNIRKFLWRRREHFLVYLSFHSYGRYWLYPWGYDSSLPDDWEELHRVGLRAVTRIRENSGETYLLGSSTTVLYAAAGASDDWAKGVAGIKYSYTVELPDEGYYGFLLPPGDISDTMGEIWPALVEMTRAVQEHIDGVEN